MKNEENVQKIEIVNDKRSGLATAGLVLGILSIIGSWIPFLNVFSIIIAVVGLALSLPALIVYLKKKKGSLGKIIAALLLCVLSLFIAIGMNNKASDAIKDEVNKNSSEYILKNDVEISFGKFTTDGNEYIESGELVVTVKNKQTESSSYSIKIEAVDANGNRIEEDTIYIDSLGSNQTTTEKAFTLVTSDKYDQLKNATFKVVDISKY